MPLIFERQLPCIRLGVWQILEDEAELRSAASADQSDEKTVRTFKNESRRKQWYACRALLKQLLCLERVKVDYDIHGKPSLKGFTGQVSFSHTREYAAVIVNEQGATGIDIEKISPRIHKVASRFLQDEELDHLSSNHRPQPPTPNPQPPIPNPYNTDLLYIYWSAKEALYKYYGKPTIDLKNDIHIRAFDYFCSSQATFSASVNAENSVRDHELRFERVGDHMLVYTL